MRLKTTTEAREAMRRVGLTPRYTNKVGTRTDMRTVKAYGGWLTPQSQVKAKVAKLKKMGFDAHLHIGCPTNISLISVIVKCRIDAQDRPPRPAWCSRAEYERYEETKLMWQRHELARQLAMRDAEMYDAATSSWTAKGEAFIKAMEDEDEEMREKHHAARRQERTRD